VERPGDQASRQVQVRGAVRRVQGEEQLVEQDRLQGDVEEADPSADRGREGGGLWQCCTEVQGGGWPSLLQLRRHH